MERQDRSSPVEMSARSSLGGVGSDGEAARPVTRARRQFGVDELHSIDRDEVRKLCHGLLLGEGAAIENARRLADFDEFTASTAGLWRRRRAIVRIFHRAIEPSDVADAEAFVEAVGADEAMLLSTLPLGDSVVSTSVVALISADETAARIIASPLATWGADGPSVAVSRLELLLQLESAKLLDPVGLQWLPSVAFNELPSALLDEGIEPQDVLEQKTFRVLTACFRFRGERFGEARRGERLPDAVIEWPDGSACSALVDCKAAANGYTMDADHLLRFENYWQTLEPVMTEKGCPLRYLIIVSSHFPGRAGPNHPFAGRAESVMERTGLQLCYVTATDLAWSAAMLEEEDASIDQRERIDWHEVLVHGMVQSEHMSAAIRGVLA